MSAKKKIIIVWMFRLFCMFCWFGVCFFTIINGQQPTKIIVFLTNTGNDEFGKSRVNENFDLHPAVSICRLCPFLICYGRPQDKGGLEAF